MKKRIFIGIPINRGVEIEINQFRELQNKNVKLRWVPDENLHITLHFIGDMEISELGKISDKINNLRQVFKPFKLEFECFELAPKYKAYMIWARYYENEIFTQLSQAIAKAIKSKKDFKPLPHITLARFKPNRNKISINNSLPLTQVYVKEFYMYESVLLPTGAQYNILDKFNL